MIKIKIEHVGATRLRVLLRDAGVDPSKMTDEEVIALYQDKFGSYCIVNQESSDR